MACQSFIVCRINSPPSTSIMENTPGYEPHRPARPAPPAGAVTRPDPSPAAPRRSPFVSRFSPRRLERAGHRVAAALTRHITLRFYDGTREYYRLLISEIIAEGCIAVRQIIGPGQNALSANVGRVIKPVSGEALFSHSCYLFLLRGRRGERPSLPPPSS